MSYIESTLSSDEKIVSTHIFHWIFLLTPVLFLFIGFLTWWVQDYPFRDYVVFLNIFFVLFALKRLIDYFCTEQVFTNKRICLKVGLIRRDTNELRNDAVENIQIKQSIIGRILGFGNLMITGRGGSPVKFRFVVNPTQVKKEIEAI